MKGHENEEVIEFCIDFIPDLKPIGVPESRHRGRLDGKGTLGGDQIICMDGHSLTEAHYTSSTEFRLGGSVYGRILYNCVVCFNERMSVHTYFLIPS